MRVRCMVALIAVASLLCGTVRAAEPVDDELHLTTTFGIWALSANGTVGVRGLESDVDASFSDILDKTSVALFPEFDLKKGNWIFAFHGMYSKLEDSVTLRDGRGGDINADMGILDLAIGYTVVRTELSNGMPLTITPAVGGRITSLELEIDPRNFGSESRSRTWFDPYVGGQVVLGLNDKLDWRTQGTIGGFGVGSDLTWSASTFIDWKLSEKWSLDIGYRALSWDYDLGDFKWDIIFHGPFIGLTAKWF